MDRLIFIFYLKPLVFKFKFNFSFFFIQSLRILQDFDRSRKFLLKAYKLNPACQDITNEIQKLDEMVAKYNALQKDIYKKMFNFSGETQDKNEKSTAGPLSKIEKNSDNFFISEKNSLEQSKILIEKKMK